jgi:hypothetical protein
MNNYIVIEMQTGASTSTLTYQYESLNAAEAKYHAILSAAAVSSVPIHAAVLMKPDGMVVKSECYYHE